MAGYFSFLEREVLILCRFLANPTVGFRQAKKESGSTQRGLRVGTDFEEFRQTPRGRGFILLELHFV